MSQPLYYQIGNEYYKVEQPSSGEFKGRSVLAKITPQEIIALTGTKKGGGTYTLDELMKPVAANSNSPVIAQIAPPQTQTHSDLSRIYGRDVQTIDRLGSTGDIIVAPGVKSESWSNFSKDTGISFDPNTGSYTQGGQKVPSLDEAQKTPGNPQYQAPTTAGQKGLYIRQQGTNEVYDMSTGQPRHVSYEEAMQKGLFAPGIIQDVKDNTQVQNLYKQYVQNQTSNTSNTTNTTNNAPTLTNDQMRANLAAILPADVINLIPDSQLAAFSAISDSFKQQYTQGIVNADIQAKDLQDAINSISNDVEFKAKYGDQLTLATANFQNNLQDFQFQTGQLATNQQQQFTDQQKALAEEKAAMGQAYSGFRQQAKQRLASDHTGIIESTRQQLKNNLTNMGQNWESMFGSAQAKTPQVDYVNPLTGQLEKQQYSPLGNIYGQVPLAKKQEQESLGAQRYGAVKLPI